MKKVGIVAFLILVAGAFVALTDSTEPVEAQQSCRGACGWQAHNCELNCPSASTSEGAACLNACQAAYRDCTANCD